MLSRGQVLNSGVLISTHVHIKPEMLHSGYSCLLSQIQGQFHQGPLVMFPKGPQLGILVRRDRERGHMHGFPELGFSTGAITQCMEHTEGLAAVADGSHFRAWVSSRGLVPLKHLRNT